LHGYEAGGCPGDGDASQQFEEISVTGRIYQLGQGINGAGSFKWTLGVC
jgi:hypothetical protein